MNNDNINNEYSATAETAGLRIGDKVKVLNSIYDDGEDHHPPGWIAFEGEVLMIKQIHGDVLAVAHEENPGAFMLYPGEYVAYTE